MPAIAALAAAGLIAAASAAHAAIVTQFQGGSFAAESTLTGRRFIPPDMGGAVGGGYVMQMINGEVSTDTTAGSSVGTPVSLDSFWSALGAPLGGTDVSDPRVIFDPSSRRWFASAMSTQSTGNDILVAVSKASDPTAGFTGFSITAGSGFADFPTLGVNGAAVTIGTNDFSSGSGTPTGSSVYSIPKASLLAATPSLSGLASFVDATQTGFTPQPVTDASGTGTATTVLSNQFGGGNLYISTISGANAAGAGLTLSSTISGLSGALPVDATQPGGTTYDSGDNRISAGSYQVGDLIYFANAVWDGAHDVIQWGVIDAATQRLVQTGTVSVPGLDLTYPSISANADGTFVIGFNGSGATTNVSAYSVTCSEIQGTCGSPWLLYAGLAPNYSQTFGGSRNRWGDYGRTTVDPANPANFWLFQQYPTTSSTWGTVITEISTAVPEPSTLVLLGLGLSGLACVRQRRRMARSPG